MKMAIARTIMALLRQGFDTLLCYWYIIGAGLPLPQPGDGVMANPFISVFPCPMSGRFPT